MRQKWLLVFLGIALVVGLIALPPAPTAQAGSNGQQIQFYNYGGSSSIAWLSLSGTNQYGPNQYWSWGFNPTVQNYSLANFWWKGQITVQWRMADYRRGSCVINVPKTLTNNWVQVGVNRGTSCYFSY